MGISVAERRSQARTSSLERSEFNVTQRSSLGIVQQREREANGVLLP
jgi:hypothetical protein